ncbi:MAG: hypothetical protein R2849_17555 [Thermomicrobiales bacterium]
MSEVEVFDAGSMLVDAWQVDSDGEAQRPWSQAEFCFTYTESSGRTDTACTDAVQVTAAFQTSVTLIAHLTYDD